MEENKDREKNTEENATENTAENQEGTIENNPNKRVIITTHSYMYSDNTRVDVEDTWDCTEYGVTGNNGEEQWDKFVKHHENIFLVFKLR